MGKFYATVETSKSISEIQITKDRKGRSVRKKRTKAIPSSVLLTSEQPVRMHAIADLKEQANKIGGAISHIGVFG